MQEPGELVLLISRPYAELTITWLQLRIQCRHGNGINNLIYEPMVTTLYSIFSDNRERGKPEAANVWNICLMT